MFKIVESWKVSDQWTIYRRYWLFWIAVDIRTGYERAVEQLRQIRSRGMPGNLEHG